MVSVGDKLTMIDGGGEYVVSEINDEEITLEHTTIAADISIYVDDIPLMFERGLSDGTGND